MQGLRKMAGKAVYGAREAAEILGVSEIELRMRIRQGIIRPINSKEPGEDLCLQSGLCFRKEELLKQWRDFLLADRDTRDEIRFLVKEVSNILICLEEIRNQLQPPTWMRLTDLARLLDIHPVTVRARIRKIGNNGAGEIRLKGMNPIRCHKVEGIWRVTREEAIKNFI